MEALRVTMSRQYWLGFHQGSGVEESQTSVIWQA